MQKYSFQEFGDSVKKIRKSRGISLENLAKMAQLSNSTLSYLENGKTNITIESLTSIIKALDISGNEFGSLLNLNSKTSQIAFKILNASIDFNKSKLTDILIELDKLQKENPSKQINLLARIVHYSIDKNNDNGSNALIKVRNFFEEIYYFGDYERTVLQLAAPYLDDFQLNEINISVNYFSKMKKTNNYNLQIILLTLSLSFYNKSDINKAQQILSEYSFDKNVDNLIWFLGKKELNNLFKSNQKNKVIFIDQLFNKQLN
ncbi:MAG: helix-turn-helix domain-containing protein [Lactobacillaceae bacterium]|jgi:transcriptional regulator with XRE-family HTH domain|nr:helix-turn-helix domain-containing protein [Lactobacillaceae bacterium]